MLKGTVIFLPGLLCDETVWAHQTATLSQWNVIVPTFGTASSITAMAELVLREAPTERFALAGHSMGGRVALEIMRLAPQRVTKLALADTGIDPIATGAAGDQERYKRFQLLQVARENGMRTMGEQWAKGMVNASRLATPVFGEIVRMIERSSADIFEAQISALLNRPNARQVLCGVTCPTLLFCGRQDGWSPLQRHEEMQSLLPKSRLVVIEDSGHMTTMEQPEATSMALYQWLQAEGEHRG